MSTVSYSPSIVTMTVAAAILEILQIWVHNVRRHIRSSVLAVFRDGVDVLGLSLPLEGWVLVNIASEVTTEGGIEMRLLLLLLLTSLFVYVRRRLWFKLQEMQVDRRTSSLHSWWLHEWLLQRRHLLHRFELPSDRLIFYPFQWLMKLYSLINLGSGILTALY